MYGYKLVHVCCGALPVHYQYSAEAVRTVLNDMSGRAEPLVEQRDEGGSDDYYLKRGGGGGAEGGGDGAE